MTLIEENPGILQKIWKPAFELQTHGESLFVIWAHNLNRSLHCHSIILMSISRSGRWVFELKGGLGGGGSPDYWNPTREKTINRPHGELNIKQCGRRITIQRVAAELWRITGKHWNIWEWKVEWREGCQSGSQMDIVRVRQWQWSMEKWGWQPNVLDHILRITNWAEMEKRADTADISVLLFLWLC